LPTRSGDTRLAASREESETVWEKLQAIETGSGPKVETELLRELLRRSPGLEAGLGDRHEVHNFQHPLAGVNAYKHRLHALRCEFVNTRLKTVELETQLARSQEQVKRLENHVRFLENTLHQMRASRAWQWTERCSRWHRTLRLWLRNLLGRTQTASEDVRTLES
jgi:hypothetical protein